MFVHSLIMADYKRKYVAFGFMPKYKLRLTGNFFFVILHPIMIVESSSFT